MGYTKNVSEKITVLSELQDNPRYLWRHRIAMCRFVSFTGKISESLQIFTFDQFFKCIEVLSKVQKCHSKKPKML